MNFRGSRLQKALFQPTINAGKSNRVLWIGFVPSCGYYFRAPETAQFFYNEII
jgi:hypothetical protein